MLKVLITSFALLISSVLYAESNPTKDLEQQLKGFTTMKANFKQVMLNEKGKPMQNSSGSMVLKRPGFFRWYTHQPNRQILVVKKDKLYIYDIDLEQLTINEMNMQQDSAPAVLLSDSTSNLDDVYTITQKPGKAKESTWYILNPKAEQENFVWMKLLFKKSRLLNMDFKDKMGQVTKIKFSNIVLNKPIKEKIFEIKPPKNVDVIDNTAKE